MEFDEEELKESATHVPDNYEPKFFINPALGQSLVFIFFYETHLGIVSLSNMFSNKCGSACEQEPWMPKLP